jgi:hypothetical protein
MVFNFESHQHFSNLISRSPLFNDNIDSHSPARMNNDESRSRKQFSALLFYSH